MRKLILTAVGATVLATASIGNAAIFIGATGTDAGSALTVSAPNNLTIPETVDFTTTSSAGGTYTSYFDFSNDQAGYYNFALISSTLGATVTLEQVLANGGVTVIDTISGATNSLSLLTGNLDANTTYRFSYTGTLPEGGGKVSGNASFYVAAVPEPATWAMMLIGFGGIGLAMRRRRRPVLAQVA